MPYRIPTTREPPRNTFWRSFFRTLGSTGDVYVPFCPPRYPQDAHHREWARVGGYLRHAMEYQDAVMKQYRCHEEAMERGTQEV